MTHPLIFHIGLQKTGTSSIQVMLAGSQDYLRSQGFFYPHLPAPPDSARIWLSPFRHNIIAGTYADYISAFPTLDAAQRQAFWESMATETASPILSAEDFSRQNDFSRFAADFAPYDVDVVMYVRRQDHFIESLYNQRNKILVSRGDPSFLNEAFLTEGDVFHFLRQQRYVPVLNYPKTLGRIGSQLSPEKFHVRVFDRSQLVDGDVCADFAAIFGWDVGKMFQPGREANGSISNVVLENLKRIFLNKGDDAAREELVRINAALEAGEDLSGSYQILAQSTRSDVLRQYRSINAELEADYGVCFT
jgi:hypothetical protein